MYSKENAAVKTSKSFWMINRTVVLLLQCAVWGDGGHFLEIVDVLVIKGPTASSLHLLRVKNLASRTLNKRFLE